MSLKHKRSQLYSFAHELIAQSTKMNEKKSLTKQNEKPVYFLIFCFKTNLDIQVSYNKIK